MSTQPYRLYLNKNQNIVVDLQTDEPIYRIVERLVEEHHLPATDSHNQLIRYVLYAGQLRRMSNEMSLRQAGYDQGGDLFLTNMFDPWWETRPASGERSPVVAGPSVALIDRLPWKWIGMIACSLLLIGGVVLLLPNRAPAQVIAVPLSDVQATPPPAAVQTVAVGGNAGRTNPVPGQPTATLSSARIPTVALGSDSIPTVTVTDTAPPTATLSSAPIPTATQSSRPTQAVHIKPTMAVGGAAEPVAPATSIAVTPEPTFEPTAIPDPRPMVPNLINMPRDQAEAKLDALGIGYTVVDVTSSSYQADIGSVAETDPAAGTRLNPGDVVVLKVKKHKPQSDNPPAAPAEPSAPPPPPKP